MENPTILVADGDPKNLQILRDSLEASGFEVIVAADGLQAWQKISSEVPDLILSEVNLPQLDGFQLLEKLKADPATSAIPLMFLTNRRELQDRVRSLRGGVKDYMIKPLHVKEVLARIRMILRRMERTKEESVDSAQKLAGRLEEFSPVDLIESFGVERKTGVLTLNNSNNRAGEIYFREGAVVNAALGNLKAEKAVYQMLPWKRGTFTMIFKEINVGDEVSVSNLGLLLQGFKRMEEREQLFKQLPSPETTFAMTETFRSIMQKRDVSPEVAKFISLIDGRRDILQIIDESTYDDIKTLERLVKLYQQGFIKPGKTAVVSAEEEMPFSQNLAEPKIVQKILQEPAAKKPAVAVVAKRVSNLPPFRPELRLPAPVPEEQKSFEPAPALPAPADEARSNHEEAPTETIDAEVTAEYDDPFAKESLERSGETSFAEVKDDRISEEDALRAQALEVSSEDEDAIEIQEVSASAEPESERALDLDRLMRTVGRGLTPEYLEPELLPLDLGEIMQRPVAPPPFFHESKKSENGEAAKPSARRSAPSFEPPPPDFEEAVETPSAEPPTDSFDKDFIKDVPAELDEQIPANIITLRPEVTPDAGLAEPTEPPAFEEHTARLKDETIASPAQAESPFLAPTQDQSVAFVDETVRAQSLNEVTPKAAPQPAFEAQASELRIVPDVPKVTPPSEPPSAVDESHPPDEIKAPANDSEKITAALVKLAEHHGARKPKLVVIGREGQFISAFVQNTLGAESRLRKVESATFQHLEMGERKLQGQSCDVIGISMEQQFTKLLATAAQDLSAYVMLVEANRRQDFNYLSYLLAMLKTSYRIPFGLVMLRSKEEKNLSKETVRDLLNLAEADYLQECNPFDLSEVAGFLSGLAGEENLARWNEKN